MKALGWLFLLTGGGATGYALYVRDSIDYKLNHFAYGTQTEDIIFYVGLGLLLLGFIFILIGYLKPKKETVQPNQTTTHSAPRQSYHTNSVRKLCNSCGSVSNFECDFCPNCGQPFIKRRPVCSKCGHEISENATFCAYCGTKT